jgi:CobQ-like glutamine amidotransferase family enzyme
MKQTKLVIAHLYPREMNIYGDAGNILTLVKRLEWRGYEAEVRAVEVGEPFDFKSVDLVFGGGGQDRGQTIVGADLLQRGEALRAAADDGLPMLLICGLYQLFGRGFTTSTGQELPGLGIFRATTRGGERRLIGNIVLDSPFGRLVGFENHSGQTTLESDQLALGHIIKGHGNDGQSKHEGAVTNNVIGTYLHGPILPKNPALADHLLLTALGRRHGIKELTPLDDELEQAAAQTAAERPQ